MTYERLIEILLLVKSHDPFGSIDLSPVGYAWLITTDLIPVDSIAGRRMVELGCIVDYDTWAIDIDN